MSVVTLLGVKVVNNPAKFTDKYEFEITFECLEALEKGSHRHETPPILPLTPSRSRVEADLRRVGHFVS